MKLVWDEHAWADYLWWPAQDRKVLKRINLLVEDIVRHGNEGIGKPEALGLPAPGLLRRPFHPPCHGLQGYWSRRITDEHRIVYRIVGDEVRIAGCRYHYGR